MRRSFAREMLLLSAPLLVVAAVAFWAMRRPKPVVAVQKKWRVESELVRHAPSPVEVRRGMDTQLDLNLRVLTPKDERPVKQGTIWNDIRLVETDEQGHDARIWDFHRRYYALARDDWKQIRRLGVGGGGGNGNAEQLSSRYTFALRRLPHPTHHLELRVDSVWRPVMRQSMIVAATPGEVAQMRSLPDALTTSRRWVLRKAGENTPIPRVSTDPLFDIRSVEFQPVTDNSKESHVRVKWHVVWRGPHKGQYDWSFAPASLGLYDEKNNPFGVDNDNLDNDWKKGRNFSIWYSSELSSTRNRAKELGSKSLFLSGWISINGRWPRQVNLKLPDWVLHG